VSGECSTECVSGKCSSKCEVDSVCQGSVPLNVSVESVPVSVK